MNHKEKQKTGLILLSLLYIFMLCYLVFFLEIRFKANYNNNLQIIPFKRYVVVFKNFNLQNLIQHCNLIESVANITLFIPFTSAIKRITGIHINFKASLYVVILSSFSIELIQYICHIGIADSGDIILNTLGGLIVPSWHYLKNRKHRGN